VIFIFLKATTDLLASSIFCVYVKLTKFRALDTSTTLSNDFCSINNENSYYIVIHLFFVPFVASISNRERKSYSTFMPDQWIARKYNYSFQARGRAIFL
jgi:hypothetical protein